MGGSSKSSMLEVKECLGCQFFEIDERPISMNARTGFCQRLNETKGWHEDACREFEEV